MSTILRIKRSETAGNPSVLAAGELAYSAFNGSGGDRLYIGMGAETLGDAANHFVIGGKYFTDMMDHTVGTLTASSALLVDSNKKIDDFYVDDIQLNGSTISTTAVDTDLTISPNGTGKVHITKNVEVDGDLKVDGGDITLTDAATNIAIRDNEASALTIKEGTNNYITLNTSNGTENITLGQYSVITKDDSDNNAVSYVLQVEHTTSGTPAAGIGTGIRFVTETAGGNNEIGGTVEFVTTDVTNSSEDFDFVVKAMIGGAAAAQIIKGNDTTLQIGASGANAVLTTLGASDLTLSTNNGTNSGTIKINDGTNGDIELTPNGTGDVVLSADTVKVGDSNADATITTDGTGDLILNTNSGTNSGTIRIYDGVDGDIVLTPNGTGDVSLSADTVKIGDNNANATLTTNGTGDLILNTNNGTNSGTIRIYDGVNADIEIEPNGTGDIFLNADIVRVGDGNLDAEITSNGLGDLVLTTNNGLLSGNIRIHQGADENIEITTNGTGNVLINADTLRVGDQNADSTITTYGTGDLILNTNEGTNSGSIRVYDGSNADIEIAPNGTGNILLSADTVRIGDQNADATLTTYGTGDLILSTNEGTNSGTITIYDGTNGNIELVPNGTGKIEFYNAYTFPSADGTNGYVLTTNGAGAISWAASSSTLSISDDVTPTAGTDTINLLTEVLTFAAGEGINTAVTANTVTISAELATAGANVGASNIGSAAFDSATFDVTSGFVTVKTSGISNTQLANSSITVGTTSISLGSSSTTIGGLTQVDINNIRITGNEISSTNSNGNISLNPNGTGSIDVNSAKIINVADPSDPTDAANKKYVDAARSGLDVKQSVKVATTASLSADYDNGTSGYLATLTNNSTQAVLEVDGVTLANGNRILVKNQGTAAHNGIYEVTDAGSISTNWVLTRASDADNSPGIAGAEVTSGMFCFVEQGSTNGDSGFVLTTNDTITLGVTGLNFTVFATSGTLVAGEGLSKDGDTLKVNVAATGGIEISSDSLQLKATVAGDGLTLTNGVLDVAGTTDRISVTANAIDIATTYAGQSSITTLGTISTGIWQGTTVAAAYGGTGQNTYAIGDLIYASASTTLSKRTIGSDGQVLQVALVGADLLPVWAHLDGGTYS